MGDGIWHLQSDGSREPEKPTAHVFAEVAEQTRLADELDYAIAWFAERHFSNYGLCASPLMLVAHCASITKKIRLGTAVVVLPLYNPARLLAEIATADTLSNGRLMLGVDIKTNLEMTEEFCDILDREKLAAEIRATDPVHMCFSFKVGATPHHAAMRSMELMMTEVRPRVARALGPLARSAAE
jgi:hypothetical protein